MDLMTVTTSYRELESKYSGFNAPKMEIIVSGTQMLAGKKLHIWDLDIELTCGYEASGCSFVVAGEYEHEKSDFSSDVDKLQVGAPIEIKVGYIRCETVFDGYINQVEYLFGVDGEQNRIRVECMDVKGLLMKNRRLEMFTQKSADAVVKTILGDTPASSYLKGMSLSSCTEDQVPLRASMLSDYDIIVEQASKLGFEFFIVQGKAYFREKEKVNSSVITLSPRESIQTAHLTLSGQKLVKTIEVRSIDETSGEQIKGSANINGTFSKGSSANKMLGSSKQVFYEPGVIDVKEATARAKARVEAMEENFGELECTCIGIPEIGPGRFVTIKDLSDAVDNKYYVTSVRHTIDDDGYKTVFKARVKSL